MRLIWLIVPWLACGGILSGPTTIRAQNAGADRGTFGSLKELDEEYARRVGELDRKKLGDLVALAGRSTGAEADSAYKQAFRIAIARDLCREAAPAAELCLRVPEAGQEVRALAGLVRVLALEEAGQPDKALAELQAILRGKGDSAPKAAEAMRLAVGEAYLQHLIRSGRDDLARKLCETAREDRAIPEPIQKHFADRAGRFELLGKLAPPLKGVDVDGKPIRPEDFKGKVVLVDFWATWCVPCVAAMPHLETMAARYGGRGFAILGVDVDPMHEDVENLETARKVGRRFLVEQKVSWPNLIEGREPGGIAAAFDVDELPANFLIGRDGKVIALDLAGDRLEAAIERALGPEAQRPEPSNRKPGGAEQ